MKMRKRNIGFIILFFSMMLLTGCEKEENHVTNWKLFDMLNSLVPDNEITGVAFDGLGNKWIGTNSGGLAKFDGNAWTIYNKSNSNLPNDHIVCLASDNLNHVWIGTNGFGLVEFTGDAFIIHNTENSNLSNDVINCIAIDNAGGKRVGTRYGLVTIQDTNWSVFYPKGILVDVNFISVDGQGNIWIASQDPIVAKFNGSNWSYYYYYETLPDASTTCFSSDLQGNAWVGAKSNSESAGYLLKLTGSAWTVYDHTNSSVYTTGINCINPDARGSMWIGSSKVTNDPNVLRFDGSNWQNYYSSDFPLNSFSPVFISADALGNKWICTHTGLFVFNENGIR
jgi:ligand-binding sensor domain-containing protein